MGTSCTEVAPGVHILIGGEFEDYYDPEFCIYNDVIRVDTNTKTYTVYGYPKADFPPTDFHAAISIGKDIWVVGSLGYNSSARSEEPIQVLRLDKETMKMTRVETIGDVPKHMCFGHYTWEENRCLPLGKHRIQVTSSEGEWVLDTTTLTWTRNNTV